VILPALIPTITMCGLWGWREGLQPPGQSFLYHVSHGQLAARLVVAGGGATVSTLGGFERQNFFRRGK
jgi:hypothetical protein